MRVPTNGKIVWAVCLCLLMNLMLTSTSDAATAQAINAGADKALAQFRSNVKGADAFLRRAKGYLVFPEVIQAGIGIGGEYGEGVLRIGGRSMAYYSLAAGSTKSRAICSIRETRSCSARVGSVINNATSSAPASR